MGVQDSLFFPVLGVILSNALYFSSFPVVVKAARRGHLGSLNVLPQALMVVSTNAWMCYALSVPNKFIMLSNLPGAVAAVGFIVVTLPLIPRSDGRSRIQVQAVLVLGTAIMLCLWSGLIFGGASHAQRTFVLGAYGSAICVLLFASPLSTMGEVIATRNSVSIYAPLTATQVTNCLMWTVYGLAIGDVWVYGPNGAGLALGLVQLFLKVIYPVRPIEAAGRDHDHSSDREQDHLKEICSDSDTADGRLP